MKTYVFNLYKTEFNCLYLSKWRKFVEYAKPKDDMMNITDCINGAINVMCDVL